jgi:type I restriction-modification system DNA methylase subunit
MSKSYKYNRSRKPITLQDAQLRMTDAIKEMEKIILSSGDEQRKIQAVHALSGLIARYAKIVETTEIIERIEVLEQKQLRKVS